MKLPAQLTIAVLALAASSHAAYHYVHYPSRNSFTPIYEKFNLASLTNNTVTFFVADQAPNAYPSNEFGSVLSQIRQAAAAWNSVAVSDLRVAFGGIQSHTDNPTVQRPGFALPGATTPGGDILFVDTPGVLGLSAPTISTTPVQGPTGTFYPIVRGLVMISRDTTAQPWPSSAETFFATAVHEMGHALGLQHTWTGSAMSQGIIRTTSRARPLDPDDIASLAVLYGKTGWQANYGTISGRVTFANNGAGASMASVVAISPTGPAVSTLTHPDGTYTIEGVPANYSYNVYAHALPPDALPADDSGLRRPADPNNQPFAATGPFQTVFYAGGGTTLDPARATSIPVAGGSATGSINFSVQPVSAVRTYNVQTYSRIMAATREYGYPGDSDVIGYPGFINSTSRTGLVIAKAQAPAILPVPQSVTILGGFAPATTANAALSVYPAVYPYSSRPGDYIALYFLVPPSAGIGPRHMVFNFGDDIYVLPYGVDLVQKGPPVTTAAIPNGDGTVTVTGAGLGYDSRAFFDGAHAGTVFFSGGDAQGSLTVTPPPGANGQSAQITVYNSDGQNSTIIPTAPVPNYTYPSSGAPQLMTVTPNSLPAGTTASIEITAANMNLVDGQVTVGFGSNDVLVRRVWVMSPTRVIVNVSVAANATSGVSEISAMSGMQVAIAPNSFQIQPARAGAPVASSIVNADPTQQTLLSGALATIFGQNLAGAQVTVNDNSATVLFSNATQINLALPAGLTPGLATVRVTTAAGAAFPIAAQIDAAAPAITAVNTTAAAGDILQITVTGLDPSVAANPQGRLRVTVSGLDLTVQGITTIASGGYQIQAVVTQGFGSAQVPLVVWADGTASAPANITIR